MDEAHSRFGWGLPMKWIKFQVLGRGSYGTVHLTVCADSYSSSGLIALKSPKIPETVSEIGKDFLRRCFARDPRNILAAEMLLHHPFLVETERSPSTTITGFESISKKPFFQKKLPPPPGFSSRSILA